MRVVIYARFSSARQNETSVEAQLKECYRYCKENDYTVKCGIYEENKTLMEINVTVPTKEDAKLLKKN